MTKKVKLNENKTKELQFKTCALRDGGIQYASAQYVGMLRENRIRISMTETGDPKENAMAERVNNTMKNELLKGMTFENIGQERMAVEKAVDFYNNERPHMSIDMMTRIGGFAMRGNKKEMD